MIEQEIPDEIAAAFERLRGEGFTNWLVPEEAERA